MKSSDRLDRLRVASPCAVGWELMTGDDRMRLCQQCSLRVYNIAEMTRNEAEALIANMEGRICARVYRRFDGTIITKDCPVGLRAIRRRMAKMAGAVCTAVLSVCSTVVPQGRSRPATLQPGISLRNKGMFLSPVISAAVSGTITDPNGEAIKGAIITLINLQTNQKQIAKSDRKGRYRFLVSEFGSYTIKVEAPGFQYYQRPLPLHLSDDLRLDVSLMLGSWVGIVVIEGPPRSGYDLDGVHIRINQE